MKYSIELNKSVLSMLIFYLFTCGYANALPDNYEQYNDDRKETTTNQILLKPFTSDQPPLYFPPEYEWQQEHNFFDEKDEDWVIFHARKGKSYKIIVKDPGIYCDPMIVIYNSKNMNEPIGEPVNNNTEGKEEVAYFNCLSEGENCIFYIGIKQCDKDNPSGCKAPYGDETEYYLRIISTGTGDSTLIIDTESHEDIIVKLCHPDSESITDPRCIEPDYKTPIGNDFQCHMFIGLDDESSIKDVNRIVKMILKRNCFEQFLFNIKLLELDTMHVTIADYENELEPIIPCFSVNENNNFQLPLCLEYINTQYTVNLKRLKKKKK